MNNAKMIIQTIGHLSLVLFGLLLYFVSGDLVSSCELYILFNFLFALLPWIFPQFGQTGAAIIIILLSAYNIFNSGGFVNQYAVSHPVANFVRQDAEARGIVYNRAGSAINEKDDSILAYTFEHCLRSNWVDNDIQSFDDAQWRKEWETFQLWFNGHKYPKDGRPTIPAAKYQTRR